MSFKVGDHVSIIEDTREGIIIEVLPFGIYLVEIDGFDWEFKEKELVLTGKQGDYKINDSEISTSPADDNESLSQPILAQETPKIEAPKPVKPVKSASTAAALSYPYLNRELIQISLTSLIVVAVLIGLNFSVFS